MTNKNKMFQPGDLVCLDRLRLNYQPTGPLGGITGTSGGLHTYELDGSGVKTGMFVYVSSDMIGVVIDCYTIVASQRCKVKFDKINCFVELFTDDVMLLPAISNKDEENA